MGVPEGEGREPEIENLFEKIMTKHFPKPCKENKHTSLGRLESPTQDEPKEANTNTHNNQNVKS